MRVKLPGSDKMKKVLLITLLIIAIGILIYEGIMNRKFKDREEINNSSNTMIINSNNSDYIEENNENRKEPNDMDGIYTISEEENNIYNEAYRLFFSNEYENAINKANELVNNYLNNYMGYNIRGIAKAYNGDYEEGMNDIDKALSIKDDYGYAIFNKALTYELYGNMDEALKWYNKDLEIEDYVWSYYGIASIYGRRGDINNTMKYLNKAIEIDPAAKEVAQNERDFEPVRSSEEFQKVVYN